MKKILTAFLLCLICLNFQGMAQNPHQTKKFKQKTKKHKDDKHDPYTINWADKDSDGDGVPDGRDKCIHTPKGEPVTTFGCPYDLDFDGTYDYQDSCKNEAGPHENHGCPWGDRDKDGFVDNKDNCPDVFGIALFHGCPDTDGDGLKDTEDNCPTVRGTLAYKGCPPPFIDSDGDGVGDYDDLCIHVKGPKTNKGCPEPKPAEKAALDLAFKNLNFETNKDVILSTSYNSLNGLASILINNPKYKLHLEGHTDNVGEDQANLDLSRRRAISTKNYLAGRGISADRIVTDGYGESKPVATNETEEGRLANRRVDMTIIQ